jgi:hypothetical protein
LIPSFFASGVPEYPVAMVLCSPSSCSFNSF